MKDFSVKDWEAMQAAQAILDHDINPEDIYRVEQFLREQYQNF